MRFQDAGMPRRDATSEQTPTGGAGDRLRALLLHRQSNSLVAGPSGRDPLGFKGHFEQAVLDSVKSGRNRQVFFADLHTN